jgi:hypothetical protein
MTQLVDICNRALQVLGTRTTVAASEVGPGSTPVSNEAIQFNLIFANMRDDLLRKAPWNCAMRTANLVYITSAPGTPENTSAATTLWAPGQPAPPWAYEYQYPVDCLRPAFVIPSTQTGFVSGVPITTAVTGGASSYWWGQPIRYAVQTDNFFGVLSAAVAFGGTGYNVGDLITLVGAPQGALPIGAPVVLQVLTAPGGVIGTVAVINQVNGASPIVGGSYFAIQANPVAQGSTTGLGTGATFNLTQATTATPQRVILTNQEFATLNYVSQITDPNIMDSMFQTAWINLCASAMTIALKENSREKANGLIKQVNAAIEQARVADGNEALTVNDVTPDFIRIRGIAYTDGYTTGPYDGFQSADFFPMY